MNIRQAQLFVIMTYALCNFYYMRIQHTIAPYRYITLQGWSYYAG